MTDPAFDRAQALDRIDGDHELLGQMIALFLNECPRLMSQMHLGVELGDAALVSRAAHAFRGSVGYLSSQMTLEAAERVEAAGRRGDLAAAARELESLNRWVLRLCTELGEQTVRGEPAWADPFARRIHSF